MAWWVWPAANEAPGSVKALALKAASGDPKAATDLKALGSSAVPGLVELLEYQEPFLRRHASSIASRLPKRLSKAFLAGPVPLGASDVQVAGARGLASLGPQADSAVPNLLSVLHDPQQYVALAAASALGHIGKAAVPGLTRALSDTNPVVRHAAAYGLGEVGADAEWALPELVGTLGDRDPSVRSSTAYSLTLIGYPTLLALSNMIDHGDATGREAAVKEFIQFYRFFRIMPPALNKMAHAEDAGSRRLAVEALGALRTTDDTTVHTFISLLRDPADEVRLASLRALNLLACRAAPAIGALQTCLQDPAPAVRAWAAKDLSAIGPAARVALESLSRCLQDDDASVRLEAQQAIDKIQATESR